MHDVFISYSTIDRIQAETVLNVLEKNGIPCWMAPRNIPGGSNYTKEIPIAIRSCQVFVLILSGNAQQSHWVLKELDSAVNMGKVILPFMLEDCQLNDEFNFLLTGAQRYSAYQRKTEALETLVNRIRAITGPKDTAAPAPEAPPAPQERKIPEQKTACLGLKACPACGSNDISELTKRIGRYTLPEKLTLLLIPVLALVGICAGLLIDVIALMMVDSSSIGDILTPILILAGLVGGGYLGHRLSMEWIRRKRVRSHINPHPFRCNACSKEFLLKDN